jgi:hypothetical protein
VHACVRAYGVLLLASCISLSVRKKKTVCKMGSESHPFGVAGLTEKDFINAKGIFHVQVDNVRK